MHAAALRGRAWRRRMADEARRRRGTANEGRSQLMSRCEDASRGGRGGPVGGDGWGMLFENDLMKDIIP